MQRFVERHKAHIVGTLKGFDRMSFRGTLRSIAYVQGMDRFMQIHHVLYRDFGSFAQKVSTRLKEHAEALAQRAGRPVVYVANASVSKEAIARKILADDKISEGLICVLSCVEPCMSFTIHRNRASKHLELVSLRRKGLHLYFYYLDRELGFTDGNR